ncbi:modular serine protease-like isoform X1 [Sitodiplosis mosellana]|uniref:modular serine protease-like isoform X1 n=1 Tax=Sitodiplosis mosellana TaxID=263140 RepID=UPI002443E2F6|nr:modular serine protease-like isoform X1 [Sitodiplosis mosellana]
MKKFIIWTVVLLVYAGYIVKGQESGCDAILSWQCKNGECIGIGERCNGIADCTDGSDETVRECISFQCSESKFRCTYGACVNKTAECNGAKECHDNSDELTEKCLPDNDDRIRGKCSAEQFQCKSGECIPIDNLCDGNKECRDSSDESVEYCASKCCPPFGFRCGYGACVDEKAKCDGNIDCLDESDENYLLCGYPETGRPQITTTTSTTVRPAFDPNKIYFTNPFEDIPNGACRITKIPRNGWIEYASEPNDKLSPGEFVNSVTTVNYKCLQNHIIEGPTANFCFQGRWRAEIPDCRPRCSTKAITGISIVATSCFLNDVEVRCSEPAEPGTIARVNCRDRYERSSASKQQIITCGDDGIWTPLPEPCSPICGEEAPEGTPYVVGGFQASINEVPWHAGIYKFNGNAYSLQCGATIVNARVVVSAMHCFWDPSEAKPYDLSQFRVAVGKEKLGFDAIENQKEQKFEVERIFYEPGYNHATGNYASDIVLIVLKNTIEFKSYITPICIPYGLTYDDRVVPAGWRGRVAGWGKTASGGAPSEFLKIVELPTIDRAQCLAESDIGFRPQITPDKFCAGHLNSNVSVCQGDSGGGLVFSSLENNRKKWYLRGIVSTGANKQDSCDSDKYSTFTNVAYYEPLISTYEPRYRPR